MQVVDYFKTLSRIRVPGGIYFDARLEYSSSSVIRFEGEKLADQRNKRESGAFIRVFNSKRWFMAGLNDLGNITEEIENLISLGVDDFNDEGLSYENMFESNRYELLKYKDMSVGNVGLGEKIELAGKYGSVFSKDDNVLKYEVFYRDCHQEKTFFSSLGARIIFDVQYAGISVTADFNVKDGKLESFQDVYSFTGESFKELEDKLEGAYSDLEKSIEFANNAEVIIPGDYPVILSPGAAGIFAHESFGHKCEADFYKGREEFEELESLDLLRELSIVDTGDIPGFGYTPFDDEGTSSKTTYLLKDGRFNSLMNSCETALRLGQDKTGNARSKDWRYEPIVRMTNTYILPGSSSLDEMVASIEKGILIDTVRHGFGMSDFTLAPIRSYMIENGKITKPVSVGILSGNVRKTLGKVSMISRDTRIHSFAKGGCGKLEQYPLGVGFGGPYVKVDSMEAR